MADSKDRKSDSGVLTTSRRGVLRALGIAGATAVGVGLSSAPTSAILIPSRARLRARYVYRLRTHGARACRACRIHHRYVVGATRRALDNHRAHPGCNCPIVRQSVSVEKYASWFPRNSGVVDLRHV
jgi:hypothetical protein